LGATLSATSVGITARVFIPLMWALDRALEAIFAPVFFVIMGMQDARRQHQG
jgi:hypothetical protein